MTTGSIGGRARGIVITLIVLAALGGVWLWPGGQADAQPASGPRAGLPIEVRRYLIVANQTLANDELIDWVAAKSADHRAEFHVVVPQTATSVLHADPATGLIGPAAHTMVIESRQASLDEGERRLVSFRDALSEFADTITGEVILSDPVTATRVVMARSSFDEIVVSTLPAGISRWLKLDLPSRIERAFNLPVTTLVEHPRS